jgi:predicted enzyme related to lactoylglutathione lyase
MLVHRSLGGRAVLRAPGVARPACVCRVSYRRLYQHELGIIDRRYAPAGAATGSGGALAFWHVDDVRAALDRLFAMGAREYEALIVREAGFVTASMVDPFGNILGVMYNPHYLGVLESRSKG